MRLVLVLLAALVLAMPIEVKAQSPTLLRDAILSDNPLRTGANFNIVANNANAATQEGLFSAPDEFGTSYFFRGTHTGLNNNVIFAGYQWKILRIEGNGNIRLIYNGVCPDNDCGINGNLAAAAATIGSAAFNQPVNQNRLMGYMFGSLTGTFDEVHANINSSNVKQIVDSWFDNNIVGTDRPIVATNTTFCNDRSLVSGTGLGIDATTFGAMGRLPGGTTGNVPTLICPRTEDRLSLTNGLTFPVGLLTADEASMAGGRSGASNGDLFLRTGQLFWTMSPGVSNGTNARMITVISNGNIMNDLISWSGTGIRPVLSLRSNVTVTGDGSLSDPYIVTGLYEPVDPGNPGGNNGGSQGGENNYNPPTSVPGLLTYGALAAGSLAALTLISRRKK